MKKSAFLAFGVLPFSLFQGCKPAETKGNCEQQMCTMEYRYISVRLSDAKGAFYLADKVESYSTDGKLLYSQTSPELLPDSVYVVISDNNLKSLTRGQNNDIDLQVYKDGVVQKTIRYVATADCCHISKISGPEVVVIE